MEQNIESETTTHEAVIEHEEDMPQERVTIDVINIVTDMNTSETAMEKHEGNIKDSPHGHGYNLRKCPSTKNKFRVLLQTQNGTRFTVIQNRRAQI